MQHLCDMELAYQRSRRTNARSWLSTRTVEKAPLTANATAASAASGAAPAAPAPARAGPTELASSDAASSDAPGVLDDATRGDILSAVDRANAAWADARRTLDTSKLSDTPAGQLLSGDVEDVEQLRGQGLTQNNTDTEFVVTDVTLDAPGHALVQTRETWDSAISNAATGQVAQQTPSTTCVETYTVKYVNGGWIVTKDDLAPERSPSHQ